MTHHPHCCQIPGLFGSWETEGTDDQGRVVRCRIKDLCPEHQAQLMALFVRAVLIGEDAEYERLLEKFQPRLKEGT